LQAAAGVLGVRILVLNGGTASEIAGHLRPLSSSRLVPF
jgi:hypothetical protein